MNVNRIVGDFATTLMTKAKISAPVAAYVGAVEAALAPLRDENRAVAMADYMKGHFQFLGIPTPVRRAAVKPIPRPETNCVHPIVRALYKRNEREYHYVALDLLDKTTKHLAYSDTLALLEELALQNTWWDSVDTLASIASNILRREPNERGVAWRWSAHESFWMNRLAILHQNGWCDETDEEVLFKLCLAHAPSKEFFVRKAIGWALREYAWTNAPAVKTFVETNRKKMSPLTIREALKNIDSRRAANPDD